MDTLSGQHVVSWKKFSPSKAMLSLVYSPDLLMHCASVLSLQSQK